MFFAIAIFVILILTGGGIIVCGIIRLFRGKIQRKEIRPLRISIPKLLTVECSEGPFGLLVLGVVVLTITAFLSISLFSYHEKKIGAKEEENQEIKNKSEFADTSMNFIFENIKDYLDKISTQFSEDENSAMIQKELVQFILNGLTRNSFDLVIIPTSVIPKIEKLVDDLISRYPDDLSIQIEATKTIRSLYWSSELPERREDFKKKWGLRIKKLEELKPKCQTRDEKMSILRLSGLYYTMMDYDRALECFDDWYEIATPEEKVRIEYDRSRVYMNKGDYEKVVNYARNSYELAQDLGMNIWSAHFMVGHAYTELNDFENGVSEFIKAYEVARGEGEADLFEKYLQNLFTKEKFLKEDQKKGLLGVSQFKQEFGKLFK